MIDNEKTSKLREKIQSLRGIEQPTKEEQAQKAIQNTITTACFFLSFPAIWASQYVIANKLGFEPFGFGSSSVIWYTILTIRYIFSKRRP